MSYDSTMRNNIFKAIDKKKEEIIGFLQEFVRIKSITRNEEIAQKFIEKKFREMDLLVKLTEINNIDRVKSHPAYIETSWVKEDEVKPHVPNVIGILKGKGGGRSLILNGHVDVVSPEPIELWVHDPWGGEVKDGKLYGRGSWDMKAGIVAMIFAVQIIQDLGINLKGDVLLESVVEEECGGSFGTLTTILQNYKADAVIIPEPTNFELCIATGGISYFRIRVQGKSAHAAVAHTGINAIEKIMKIYNALVELDIYRRNKIRYSLFEKWCGQSCNLHVGLLRAGDWAPTVAGWAEMEGRVGFIPGEKIENIKKVVEETVNKAASLDSWMKDNPPKIDWFGWQTEPFEQKPINPLFQIIRRTVKDNFSDIKPIYMGMPGGLDMRLYIGYTNTPAVSFGPRGANMHGVNEFVIVEDVIKLTKILTLTLMEWCGYDKKIRE